MTEKSVNLDDGMDLKSDDELDIDVLDGMPGAEAMPECSECPYHQFCLKPPEVDEEEAEQIIAEAEEEGQEEAAQVSLALQRAMTRLPACPRFIEEIKENGDLAKDVKELMQDKYGGD